MPVYFAPDNRRSLAERLAPITQLAQMAMQQKQFKQQLEDRQAQRDMQKAQIIASLASKGIYPQGALPQNPPMGPMMSNNMSGLSQSPINTLSGQMGGALPGNPPTISQPDQTGRTTLNLGGLGNFSAPLPGQDLDTQLKKKQLEAADITIQEKKQKQKEDAEANKTKTENLLTDTKQSLNVIKQVASGMDNFGAKSYLPYIRGTKRNDWKAALNQLTAKTMLNLMNKMKAASKTGATGFGQLNEGERLTLQQGATQLQEGVSPERAKEILTEMYGILRKVLPEDSQGEYGDLFGEKGNDQFSLSNLLSIAQSRGLA